MSTDYFAHGVYGVLLDYDDQVKIRMLCHEKMDDNEELSFLEALGQVMRENAMLFEKLYEKTHAPKTARFSYSGDEDDRPGRCATGPDEILLGFGMPRFPLHPEKGGDPFSPGDPYKEFWDNAEWHTWVEAG